MTTEEIYKTISSHMLKGVMIHEQLSMYYYFLGLYGYSKCHEYHFLQENKGYKEFNNYVMLHYNKLIQEEKIDNPYVIPQSWFNYERKDVDNATKKKACKEGINKWIEWEEETKQLYQYVYPELINNGDVAFAIELSEYIKDVSEEIAEAYQQFLAMRSVDYDLQYIFDKQDEIQQKYKKKIRNIYKKGA